MFNNLQYNTGLYNAVAIPDNEVLSTSLAVFEDLEMSDTNGICITKFDEENAPNLDLLGGNSVRKDGQFISGSFHRRKRITFEGIISKSTQKELDEYIDTVKKLLRIREGNLDIVRRSDATTRRRYIATLINPDSMFPGRQGWHVTFIPFKFVFECREPFGTDLDYTVVQHSSIISEQNRTATNAGTAPARPIVYVNMTQATGATSIAIENKTTGEKIEYSNTLNQNDIIEFNTETLEVLRNGVANDYDGAFPFLEPGHNIISTQITSTSHNANITIKWLNSYF